MRKGAGRKEAGKGDDANEAGKQGARRVKWDTDQIRDATQEYKNETAPRSTHTGQTNTRGASASNRVGWCANIRTGWGCVDGVNTSVRDGALDSRNSRNPSSCTQPEGIPVAVRELRLAARQKITCPRKRKRARIIVSAKNTRIIAKAKRREEEEKHGQAAAVETGETARESPGRHDVSRVCGGRGQEKEEREDG